MRLRTVAQRHLADIRHRLAPATVRERRYSLEHFVAHIGGDMEIRAVKKGHIEDWLHSMNVSPGTLRNRFLAVRMMFAYAVEEGWTRSKPTLGITLPRQPRRQPRALTFDDLLAIDSVLPDLRARVIVALALNEGLRRSEIASLQLGDIDLPSMTIRVVTVKSRSEDLLPLTEATWEDWMRPYLAERGRWPGALIYSYTTRGHLSPGRIGAMVSQWLREAGVKGAAFDGKSLHAFRHTTADSLLRVGAPPDVIQRALRHATLSSTWQYLRNRRSVDELRPWMGPHIRAFADTA